jgi:hypothetical protein
LARPIERRRNGLTLDPEGWFGIADSEWLDPKSTVLLIVDMQPYDADRSWALIGKRGTETPLNLSRNAFFYSPYTTLRTRSLPEKGGLKNGNKIV